MHATLLLFACLSLQDDPNRSVPQRFTLPATQPQATSNASNPSLPSRGSINLSDRPTTTLTNPNNSGANPSSLTLPARNAQANESRATNSLQLGPPPTTTPRTPSPNPLPMTRPGSLPSTRPEATPMRLPAAPSQTQTSQPSSTLQRNTGVPSSSLPTTQPPVNRLNDAPPTNQTGNSIRISNNPSPTLQQPSNAGQPSPISSTPSNSGVQAPSRMPTRIRPPDSQPPLQDGTQNPSHNSLQTRGSLPSGEVPAARITGPQNSTVQPSALPSTQPLGNQNETRPGTSGLAPRRAPFRSNVVETDPNRVATRPLRASGTTTDQDPAPPSTIQIHPADVWRSAAAVAMDDDQVINGRLVRLEQVIGSGGDKEARKRAVQTYWQLAVAIADYRFAVEEHQWMQDIGTTPRTADQTLWQAAVAEAEARMQEARLAVVNKQYDLIDASPLTTDRGLPVPSDAPLVTKYRTNYEAYAKSGRWPQSLGKIDRSLPMVQELIKVRARAVHMSRLAFFETSNAMTLGQASMSDVLDSIRRVRDQRLAFLGVLRDYNQLIAEYALTVGPAGADADRVVAMLIKRSSTDSTPTGNVRQATAIEQRPATGWRSIIRE